MSPARSPYIAGRGFDWAFFLLPPGLSLILGALMAHSSLGRDALPIAGRHLVPWNLFCGTLTSGHLFAVFLRSHGNPVIFRRHPLRFTLLPAAVLLAMMRSLWAAAIVTVLVVFWDVYHSAMQTFGFARMYERNAGNDPQKERAWDLWLNLILYIGPILAGAALLPHVRYFAVFADLQAHFFLQIPALAARHQPAMASVVLIAGTIFVLVYLARQVRRARRGERIPLPKVFLLSTTGLVSIWAWGLNPWNQAFFIMNLFHAVQYLALVWWSEHGVLGRRLHLHGSPLRRALLLGLFFGIVLGYGVWAELVPEDDRLRWSIAQVVSLMHFFYDGFIWSVRKDQI